MKKNNLVNLIASILAFLLLCDRSLAAAETIYINARIFTADEKHLTADAMAVQNGRILAIGEQGDVLKYRGPKSKLVDLQGKRVLPGLIDTHTHAIIGALAELAPNLNDISLDIHSINQKIEKWLIQTGNKTSAPFVVYGTNPSTWSDPKTLKQIFDVGPWNEKPIVLMGSDLHTAWANRAMLMIAGIDKEYVSRLTPQQRHTIGTHSNGEPNGVLVDAGVDLVTVLMPMADAGVLEDAARLAVKKNNQYGITAWMDPAANAGPGEALFSRALKNTGNGILPAYKILSEKGELTARVAALLVASPLSDGADLDQLETVRQRFQDVENLTLPGIKIFADGVLEYPAQSAALLGHYQNSGLDGELLLSPQALNTLVDAADERGLLVHIHALGDRAVQESLNAFEAARNKRDSGITHSITHLQLVDRSDYSRFAPLNVIAVMQLHWAEMDNYLLDLVKPYIGEAEFAGQYPARSLQTQGTIIAGASDWPISSANPWEAMHHAMTRLGTDGGLNKDERLDINAVLLAYTRHAAQAIGRENDIGTLSVGKMADFIILDRDVLVVGIDSIEKTKVLKTYFSGKLVYSADVYED